jgi:hypothetical protein
MVACRSSLENTQKMNLIPVFNKTLPRAHMELELDVLGVSRTHVKYVVHLSERKQIAQTAIDQFLVSKNFRGLTQLTTSSLWRINSYNFRTVLVDIRPFM